MTGRIICVSFADGAFSQRRAVFNAQANKTGFFDEVAVYNFDQLPSDFKREHGDFIRTNTRGFGYWIWKPVIIAETLKRAGPNDIVVYLDAGYTLNPEGHRRFTEYLEMTRDSCYGMLSFQNIFTESHWTKSDLAQKLGIGLGHTHMKTSQLGSGLLMLTPSCENIDIINTWQNIAIEDKYHYSDDSPSISLNHSDFQEHRHDQSIASLLRKSRGTVITHYEVQSYKGRFEELQPMLPAWATRARK